MIEGFDFSDWVDGWPYLIVAIVVGYVINLARSFVGSYVSRLDAEKVLLLEDFLQESARRVVRSIEQMSSGATGSEKKELALLILSRVVERLKGVDTMMNLSHYIESAVKEMNDTAYYTQPYEGDTK